MSITDAIVIVALILAIVDEFRAKGQALTTWSAILICAALLWHLIPT